MKLLPPEYLERMKIMLGDEFEHFLECCREPAFRGIRLNPLKCDETTLRESLPFPIEPSPFSPLGYCLPAGVEKIGKLAMHHAGAFYSQEPSAASAVTVLNPQPGETVLDLCAAPGGKSTQIASLLKGKGLLWSNEVIRSRASVLLSNMERMGVRNAVISSCHPEKLCSSLRGYFDRVLVDAPCSGEGLFRREEQALQDWSPEHVKACAVRQLAILESAAQAVRGDGLLVYSTCTFSSEEDEGVVTEFLSRHDDFEPVECGAKFGRPATLPFARRIFPMDGGEGHFVAAMRRKSENLPFRAFYPIGKAQDPDLAEDFCRSVFQREPFGRLEQNREDFYLMPDGLPDLSGLGVLRAGVLLGTRRGKRIEPAHALFMASSPLELRSVISFSHDSPRLYAFLHGEEVEAQGPSGYAAVAVDGVTTGFGKLSGGRLKNHYPKGLRNTSAEIPSFEV